jgi:predicted RND superfamily exporter protein
MKLKLTDFSLRFPWIIVLLVVLITGFGVWQFPKVKFDNDPENMLSPGEPVRIFHNQTKAKFALYDMVIAGVVNTNHPDGVFNVETLGRIDVLTKQMLSLRQNADGLPEVTAPAPFVPDLRPDSAYKRFLTKVFRQDVNRLFTENGGSAIVKEEIISPSVVDNIKQAERGALKIEYLMEKPPATREEALTLRDDAMNNPLYKGTLVSEDGKAIALYIPIIAKTYSYNVANLVEKLTADWPAEDRLYITGQPVAQDTFGVEMLIQMASSAPLAGLVIFLLLLLFFRRVSLIIAPMLVAVFTVLCTMGLLIGGGYDVHIMSSMIAIFLMPISVADSVHILSEFFDAYHRFRDKKEAVRHVVGHLFMPMLYTSLTTIAGFASLITTPIPPVQVFGAHVAIGVALAWVLTMTFVPAYIMLFVPQSMLDRIPAKKEDHKRSGLDRMLEKTGEFSYKHWKLISVVSILIVVFSVAGIQRIRVNDNPVKWFTKNHRIRIADEVLNRHFDGTYTAYLTLTPENTAAPVAAPELSGGQTDGVWIDLADAINYLEAPALENLSAFKAALPNAPAELFQNLEKLSGEPLREAALAVCDLKTDRAAREKQLMDYAEQTAPPFKRPELLRWVDQLQSHLAGLPKVGKTSSAVDALKKASYELNYVTGGNNDLFYSVPGSAAACGQVFMQLEGMKKKDSLFHLVTRDYREADIWVQLTSGDNTDMAGVAKEVERFIAANPPPVPLRAEWAGLTYLNVVWQDRMVSGMMSSLLSSFVMVFIMMVVLYRSILFGLLSMIPLSVTIVFIYGLLGWTGKDYDMPVAVLSSLTLGLSVDFAIHFLERARELQKTMGSWAMAIKEMFKEPAMAISRNAITVAVGFLPLLFAPLAPYRTVGFFLAAIMMVSWLATIFILAALVTALKKRLFKTEGESK